MSRKSAAWLQNRRVSGQESIKLFCFPYAGGSASVYSGWAGFFPPTVRVIPVELPGRGSRLNEPLISSLSPLINILVEDILPQLDSPFTFFGHSMGALIAFEMTRYLYYEYGYEPLRLFVSGRRAPQSPTLTPSSYNLQKDELIEELRKIGGTPSEVLGHAELMEIMLPVIRADFQLHQTYEFISGGRLTCPISAYGGMEDFEVPRSLLLSWRELTTSTFGLHMLPGDHFFLRSSQTLLLELLMRELR
jgi:medium-chain acyl-[acyl-carrier-protein] hydrolase